MNAMALAIPSVIGHRGAAAIAPENTLSGIRAAAEAGARWVEVDVQLTRDGVPVLFHDEELDRTTDGGGLLAETDFDRLRRRDAGCWFGNKFIGEPVPSLEEAVELAGVLGIGMNLELKVTAPERGEPLARTALDVARRVWPAHLPAPLISSFDVPALEAARRICANWPVGLIVERPSSEDLAVASGLGAVSLHADHRVVTRDLVATARAHGLAVLAYTVNTPAVAIAVRNAGALAIITDDPAAMLPAFSG